ncbi:glycoside hydrolase family 25 protein [Thermothielavioides terrestris NRRL 8126]|uniref:Lysozyme n=1 Tax=Thermothielavioides terrestris (strain ATCC 38088 / NRRL 8126) TaxID=578455 RepID=G2QWF5_THETT|nr:glycoside hydrolase family 25 protein [Thermothielavioides terrestris NRRL 8126]AEO63930.1 glycoside hydrolase family 25 protein [Thermothielavioides terrestris NRRL 8126]
MLTSALLASLALAAGVKATVQGFDISHYQPNVDFAAAYNAGARFVIIKATEGTSYIDPSFSSHYTGATKAGLIRGGYHFAHPGETTGAAQADYFIAHGGGWTPDGITLPGMLDLESESNGECWGLSASAMVAWIRDFSDRYHERVGVYPMLYTNPSWWQTCTGNSNAFVNTNPLVLAHYSSSVGTIPGGWPYQTIWQNSDSYKYGGDSDIFNGSLDRLQALAKGS